MADSVRRREPRVPVFDPKVKVEVTEQGTGAPRHRLVAIGDSLTQGFQSAAVFNTSLSYPAIVAYELGCLPGFRFPLYEGFGGLPFNLELFLRDLDARYGKNVDWWEAPLALFRARNTMDRVEDYWERGPGRTVPSTSAIMHNLAVFGWDLRDALSKSADECRKRIDTPKDDLVSQVVQNAGERAALRVLPTQPQAAGALTQLGAAAELGKDTDGTGAKHGIETLIVFLGANNALRAVTDLRVKWSEDSGFDDLDAKRRFTVWQPKHFRSELRKVAAEVFDIKARHVIWCTVPHVTIAPMARGVAGKTQPGSRYFPYYTRPWIKDRDFDAGRDPSITGEEAHQVDDAIDDYNDAITETVRAARKKGKDWYLLETCGLMDRLASRRYAEDPQARPPWWQPYPLPSALRALSPPPNSHFLAVEGERRTDGGLFSLDGVHPTTVGYGILAQEVINVMRLAGVRFYRPVGGASRPDPVLVDFDRLIRHDTLVNRPPANLGSALSVMGWADEALDLFRRVFSPL
ncbi:SGNH/GDSL hydrolase family protein [Streptomyces sp. NPDC054855]